MTSATQLLGLSETIVPTSAGLLRAFVGGDGPPLVLVHGLGGGAANWVDVVRGAVDRHRVIVPELPGHGGSQPPSAGAGVAFYADALAAALEALGVQRVVVSGHSFGGHVALRLALRHPALVAGLLLVAPSGVATRRPSIRALVRFTSLVRPGARIAPLALRLSDRLWFRRLVLRPWLVSDPAAISPRATRGFFAQLREHADVRAAARAMLADDPLLDPGALACPTLVLWGARDAQLPLDDAFAYARRLRAPLRLVADCGHLLIGERPDAVLDAISALEASAT